MAKHPNRKSIGKHDIIRAMTGNIMKMKSIESKVEDLDVIVMEFIEFMGKQKKFEKYLNGKYKQKERKRSGTSSTAGTE